MHAYRWSTAGLLQKLKEFQNGQFRIEGPNGGIFQGEFASCEISDPKKKILRVHFNWLAAQRFTIGDGWKMQEYWGKLDLPASPVMTVEFTYYYFQRQYKGVKGKPDREERVKLWTKMGEIGRFYKIGDPLILVQQDGRFLPMPPPQDEKGE